MYTNFPRGSEWRRWDLHIHTPETKKNDNFKGNSPAEKWNNYITDINSFPEEISVIGVTDYLSVDNYFKFKKFVADGVITKHFDLVLPNIELRVVPVTGSATPINLHCIFNPKFDHELLTRFLGKLKFDHGNSGYSAHPDELRRLGRNFTGNQNLDADSALKKGIEQCVIEMGVLRDIFKDDPELRDNTIVVVSNKSNDGVSGITKHADFFTNTSGSQLDGTRQSIYQFADAIFSSSESDSLYFTGRGNVDSKETVIRKCGALMPCFHGCDAHENSKIFQPDQNRYCWIKADPTFEGLKQTLYEPEDRVKIQAFRPDIKNERYIISEVNFSDQHNLFGTQKLLLNENLNGIIGGKSSGKSLLLYSIAQSIDPKQVVRLSNRLGFEGYDLGGNFNFEVIWKNGEKDELNDKDDNNKTHKITYIPQLYIHYLVEKNNKEDLNELIESILLQNTEFKHFYESKQTEILRATNEIDNLINTFFQIRTQAVQIQSASTQIGKSASISKGMDSLQQAITAGQKASNLDTKEFEEYESYTKQKVQANLDFKQLSAKEDALNAILVEVNGSKFDLLGGINEDDNISIRGKIDRLLDRFTEVPADVASVVKKLRDDFDVMTGNLKSEIEKVNLTQQKAAKIAEIRVIEKSLEPYLLKIAGQEELKKLTDQLAAEQQKLQQALTFEKQIQTYFEDYKNVRARITSLLSARFECYRAIAQEINRTRQDIGTGIKLECKLLFPQKDYPFYDQVNKAALAQGTIFFDIFKNGLVNYEEIIKLFSQQLTEADGKLNSRDNTISIPLRDKVTLEEILRGLLQDKFLLDFTVTYKGDDLLKMSPGKKGTVLLILFLQISSAEYPILIDQPEDNLDNRTIYDLLCTMIKLKKKQRQIIIVSHNANLVIATDAENIIVANQEGQDTETTGTGTRFGYVNGSLEHSFEEIENEKRVLHKQGIREHACDILEGGDEAFKQRERKYSIK